MHCLFCQSDGPFTIEHVIPESLGNDELILLNQVCGSCNNHFSKLENEVLHKTPLAFWRTALGIKTKHGKLPTVDTSQPKREKGLLPSTHPNHDDNIGFTSHEDGSTSVEINDSRIINEILSEERSRFQFVMTPRLLFIFGRFLCKIGIELLCIDDQLEARISKFERARRFARYGEFDGLWPIFHFTKGEVSDFRRLRKDSDEILEDIDCYTYSLFEFDNQFVLFQFGVGTDNWIICLNDPFPTPKIKSAFPDQELHCIWYSTDEINHQRSSTLP